ncbi:MAG: hypothetical protein M5U12_05770 [Verrucomicrobia bacterium]|nr:hypothetical protein [Verrucomicrobiota bacterium]
MKPIATLHVRRLLLHTAGPLSRRRFLRFVGSGAAVVLGASSQPTAAEAAATAGLPDPVPDLVPAPKEPAQWPEFRRQLAAWREARRRELNYSDALYRRADFAWVPGNFACAFLMLNDALFYDPDAGGTRCRGFLNTAGANSAGSTAWCSGTRTRASGWTPATSSTATATNPAASRACAVPWARFIAAESGSS